MQGISAKIGLIRVATGPQRAENVQQFWKIPYSAEQGKILSDQGTERTDQGIYGAEQPIRFWVSDRADAVRFRGRAACPLLSVSTRLPAFETFARVPVADFGDLLDPPPVQRPEAFDRRFDEQVRRLPQGIEPADGAEGAGMH